jgi:hypothetical protein
MFGLLQLTRNMARIISIYHEIMDRFLIWYTPQEPFAYSHGYVHPSLKTTALEDVLPVAAGRLPVDNVAYSVNRPSDGRRTRANTCVRLAVMQLYFCHWKPDRQILVKFCA